MAKSKIKKERLTVWCSSAQKKKIDRAARKIGVPTSIYFKHLAGVQKLPGTPRKTQRRKTKRKKRR